MTEDRVMVVEAVLKGMISVDHLTNQEIREIEAKAYEIIIEEEMARAVERGCSVFDGIEGDTVQ